MEIKVPLPAIKGHSLKQIKWAEDIRNRFVEKMDEKVDFYMAHCKPELADKIAELIAQARKQALNGLGFPVSDAGGWISLYKVERDIYWCLGTNRKCDYDELAIRFGIRLTSLLKDLKNKLEA